MAPGPSLPLSGVRHSTLTTHRPARDDKHAVGPSCLQASQLSGRYVSGGSLVYWTTRMHPARALLEPTEVLLQILTSKAPLHGSLRAIRWDSRVFIIWKIRLLRTMIRKMTMTKKMMKLKIFRQYRSGTGLCRLAGSSRRMLRWENCQCPRMTERRWRCFSGPVMMRGSMSTFHAACMNPTVRDRPSPGPTFAQRCGGGLIPETPLPRMRGGTIQHGDGGHGTVSGRP